MQDGRRRRRWGEREGEKERVEKLYLHPACEQLQWKSSPALVEASVRLL